VVKLAILGSCDEMVQIHKTASRYQTIILKLTSPEKEEKTEDLQQLKPDEILG
jgi:hypothetical protein